MIPLLTAQLAQVEANIASARAAVEEHRRIWRHQCSNGLFGSALVLEDEIVKTERAILRFVVRREALQLKLNEQQLNTQQAEVTA